MAGGATHAPVISSLYVHVPICRQRCDYCDFFTRTSVAPAVQEVLLERTVEQWGIYQREFAVDRLDSIYIGGGTPSAMGESTRNRFLPFLRSLTDNGADAEVTFEINPEDVTIPLLYMLEESGVNRLSLGVQSLDPSSLRMMGRHTSVEDTRRGIETVSNNWRGRWSADVIVAVPGQSLRRALSDLSGIIAYGPDHVSLYELEIVPATRLGHAAAKRRISPLPDEEAERIILRCGDLLEERGYRQYEVSNFARPGFRSVHNLRYWRMEPYLGVGAGAVGTMPSPVVQGLPLRLEGTHDFARFREDREFGVTRHEITTAQFCREHIMMALRTTEGIDTARFKAIFGYGVTTAIPRTLERRRGHLTIQSDRIAPNRRGLRFANAIARDAFTELDKNPPPRDFPAWPA